MALSGALFTFTNTLEHPATDNHLGCRAVDPPKSGECYIEALIHRATVHLSPSKCTAVA